MMTLKQKRLKSDRRRKKHRALRFGLGASFVCVLCAVISVSVLKSRGLYFKNELRKSEYPCRGAYLTEECGEINWQLFSKEPLDFIYIRSGKGRFDDDSRFYYNAENAVKCGMPIGVVHDYDFSESGVSQAKAFAEKLWTGMLIPAIDIRRNLIERILYSDNKEIAAEINAFAAYIKEKIGCSIILYCDREVYNDLNVETSGAAVWAEDVSPVNYSRSWVLLSFNDHAGSKAMRSSKSKYTSVTAAKGVTAYMFKEQYTIGKLLS